MKRSTFLFAVFVAFGVGILAACVTQVETPSIAGVCEANIACTQDSDCGSKCSCCKNKVCVKCTPALE